MSKNKLKDKEKKHKIMLREKYMKDKAKANKKLEKIRKASELKKKLGKVKNINC